MPPAMLLAETFGMTKSSDDDTGRTSRNRAAPVSRKPAKGTIERGRATTGPREVIEQAARDVSHGLVDTDRHGIPNDVPGPRTVSNEGADAPAGGGNRASYSERRRAPRIASAPPPEDQEPNRRR